MRKKDTVYYYEYVNGNNGPASRLKRIGNKDEYLKEKKKRSENGNSFFETEVVNQDLGETIQKRDLDGNRVGDKRIPRRGRL